MIWGLLALLFSDEAQENDKSVVFNRKVPVRICSVDRGDYKAWLNVKVFSKMNVDRSKLRSSSLVSLETFFISKIYFLLSKKRFHFENIFILRNIPPSLYSLHFSSLPLSASGISLSVSCIFVARSNITH